MASNGVSNVERIRARVREAALRAGRQPGEVTIIGVSKTRTVAEITPIVTAGITDLGENRVQEIAEKAGAFTGVTWHLIGSLQTNKVKQALNMAHLVHSLDRDSLLVEMAKQAERLERPCNVLVQVNVSGEASKQGISPEELPAFLRRISDSGNVHVHGLMTMAPIAEDPETARPHFRRLRQLAEQVREADIPRVGLRHLSMGMSGDFEVAVEEGATLVRIGTALFGARD